MKRALIILLCCGILLPLFALPGIAEPSSEENEVELVSSEARPLKVGDKGDEVKALQTRLRDVKYYTAKVTGNYLQSTQAAVKKVQEAYGLPVTGDADLATLEIIYGDCHRPLSRGMQGKDVSRLQTRLSELGYYWGKISGNYLDGTTAAIGNFQQDNGLDKTGKADVNTLLKLYSDNVYLPTPDPNATPAPSLGPTAVPDMTYPGKLSYGSTGPRVKQLQERLKELGYFTRNTTTGFYKNTQAALQAFQKQNGLKPDGIIGEETWNALYAPDAARPHDRPKPTPEPTPIPFSLEVDVNNQLIKIYERDENGEYTKFVRAMWCSTGTKSFPSELGTFTLTQRRARWAEFPTWGGGKAQYWVRITPEIAFHSVIYNANDNKAVNMKSVNALGKRASHGCIRLTLQDAKWMYLNAGEGVQVTIHEDAAIDPELKAAYKPGTYSKQLYAHPVTPAPTQMPVYNPQVPPQGDIRTLKVGSEGEDVFWLQSKLKELGYFTGTVTGEYREGTRDAVAAYQKTEGVRGKSGTADKNTLEALYARTLAESALPTPLPTDAPPAETIIPPSETILPPAQTPAPPAETPLPAATQTPEAVG